MPKLKAPKPRRPVRENMAARAQKAGRWPDRRAVANKRACRGRIHHEKT